MTQVGIVNNESFSQQLRGISQRRRQGSLEISSATSKVQIYFVLGRIIEVMKEGVNPVEELAQIFQNAGLVSQDLGFGWNRSYRALLDAMQAQNDSVSEELFREALKHRVLSKLYAMNGEQIATYNFSSQMIESEKDLLPSISVGQLLLDLVALDSDREKFAATFPEGKLIAQATGQLESMNNEERAIYDLLNTPRSVDDLARVSMLSAYPLREILLRLAERKSVQLAEPEQKAEAIFGADILSQFDTSIDAVFRTPSNASESRTVAEGDDDLSISYEPMPQSALFTKSEPAHRVENSEVTEEQNNNADELLDSVTNQHRLSMLSAQLLNHPLLPKALSLLIFGTLLMLPLLLWGISFEEFAH